MNSITVVSIVAGAAILGLVLYRQMQPSRLRPARLLAVPALLALGGAQLLPALTGIGPAGAAMLAGAATVGAVLGVLRGLSVRQWTGADGGTWTQGTWVTLGLWAVLIALRLAMSAVDRQLGASAQTMNAELIGMAFATFSGQNLVTWVRAGGLGVLAPAGQ